MTNANKPEKKAEVRMPRADLVEADRVSSEIWPEASKPVMEAAATRLFVLTVNVRKSKGEGLQAKHPIPSCRCTGTIICISFVSKKYDCLGRS